MMRWLLLLVGVLFALWASGAQAHTTITCNPCSFPYQRWVDEATVPTPDASIWVEEHVSGCQEKTAEGCTDENDWIWLRGHRSAYMTHWTFLHELGHVFDHYEMTAWARSRFREIGGWMSEPWEPNGVNEIFADTYRLCAWPRARDEALAPPGLRRHLALETICLMIRRLGLG